MKNKTCERLIQSMYPLRGFLFAQKYLRQKRKKNCGNVYIFENTNKMEESWKY